MHSSSDTSRTTANGVDWRIIASYQTKLGFVPNSVRRGLSFDADIELPGGTMDPEHSLILRSEYYVVANAATGRVKQTWAGLWRLHKMGRQRSHCSSSLPLASTLFYVTATHRLDQRPHGLLQPVHPAADVLTVVIICGRLCTRG
jgi:hypothetical protein